MQEYPECEKLKKIQKESYACGDFYHWAINKGYIKDGNLSKRQHKSLETLLAEFFEIDVNKLEKEKRVMLDSLRKDQKG